MEGTCITWDDSTVTRTPLHVLASHWRIDSEPCGGRCGDWLPTWGMLPGCWRQHGAERRNIFMEQVATLQAQGPLKTTQVSVEGKWVSVSAIEINSRAVVTSGKWIKIAAIQDEYWQATACEDPETYIRAAAEPRLQRRHLCLHAEVAGGHPQVPLSGGLGQCCRNKAQHLPELVRQTFAGNAKERAAGGETRGNNTSRGVQ